MPQVYAIHDPRSHAVKYVGKSIHSPWRIGTHVSAAKNGKKHPLYDWMRKELSEKRTPYLTILHDSRSEAKIRRLEKKEIRSRNGLLNITHNKSKTEKIFLFRLPLTKPNQKALKVKAATEGRKIQEVGNELVAAAIERDLQSHREALKRGDRMTQKPTKPQAKRKGN